MLTSSSLPLRRSARSFIRPTSLRSLTTSGAPAPTLHPSQSGVRPPHLLTLADLTVPEIQGLIDTAHGFKTFYKARANPADVVNVPSHAVGQVSEADKWAEKSLDNKTVALVFSKRSTRTRVASETAIKLLGESSRRREWGNV